MKKSVLSLLLALLLTLGVVLPSCTATTPAPIGTSKQTTANTSDDPTNEEDSPSDHKDLPPDGYLFAQDGALRFAYPSDWVEDLTSESLSYEHPTKYSFLTLETADVTDEFHTMTAEQYEERYGTAFAEEVGGALFNVSAKHVTNPNELDVAFFSCFVSVEGLTLKQLLYAVNVGDTSYRLVFLLEETSEEFEQTVLDSLKEVAPIKPDPNVAPRGYRFYTQDDLRFIYPAAWDSATMTDPETNNDINVNYGYAAAYFPEMNEALFDAIIGAEFQSAGFSVEDLVIEQQQNTNGIRINRIIYSLSANGYDQKMQQQIFAFTLNRTAYAMVLTLATPDDPLAQKIFHSITNLNPASTPASGETTTYSHFNLSFSVPASFGVDDSTDQLFFYRGTSSIAVSSAKSDEDFDAITLEEFEETYVPPLEQELGAQIYNLSLGRTTTQEGLTVTSFHYSFDLYGMRFYQTIYLLMIDQTTHTVVVTAASDEAFYQIVEIICFSFKPISGPNYSKIS